MNRFLVVEAGGERWAIPSSAVGEVVEDPAIEPMPALPERVRGVLSHRDAWLPVLDLARAMGLGRVEGPGAALVMGRARTGYALLVERALGTQERDAPEGEWTDDDGVVTVLDVEGLFQAPAPQTPPADASRAEPATAPRSVVCFRVGEAEFGFSANEVDRIWPYESPEPVPGLPDYVVGVLPLRGFAMPILDLGAHLGVRPEGGEDLGVRPEGGEHRRVLVLGRDDRRVGWVVDEVIAVAPFPADRWTALPGWFGGRPARLVEAVVRRDDRGPMLVLRAGELLDRDQRGVLQGSARAE